MTVILESGWGGGERGGGFSCPHHHHHHSVLTAEEHQVKKYEVHLLYSCIIYSLSSCQI